MRGDDWRVLGSDGRKPAARSWATMCLMDLVFPAPVWPMMSNCRRRVSSSSVNSSPSCAAMTNRVGRGAWDNPSLEADYWWRQWVVLRRPVSCPLKRPLHSSSLACAVGWTTRSVEARFQP
jgi:hypothetical protein